MDPDKPKQTRREAVKRVTKAAVAILIALAALVLLYGLVTRWRGWPAWTGLGDYVTPAVSQGEEYQRGKTLWDLAELLIIPLVLALGAIWFNRQERKTEREIATKREQTERELAADRIQENALQAFLDRMTELLLEKGLRESGPDDEVRSVARARTLTVLRSLDSVRKGEVVRFLYESGLINIADPIVQLIDADLTKSLLVDVNLSSADLSGANLNWANLADANMTGSNLSEADLAFSNLSGATLADAILSEANLTGTNLIEANLRSAILNDACLHKANLCWVNLQGANLEGANIQEAILLEAELHAAHLTRANLQDTDLRKAGLRETDLTWANLQGANFQGAFLSFADLRNCKNWTSEQISGAGSLEGSLLPEDYTPPNRATE